MIQREYTEPKMLEELKGIRAGRKVEPTVKLPPQEVCLRANPRFARSGASLDEIKTIHYPLQQLIFI